MKNKLNFDLPVGYDCKPTQKAIDEGILVQGNPKLFPDGVVRYETLITEKGADVIFKAIQEGIKSGFLKVVEKDGKREVMFSDDRINKNLF